MRGVDTRLLSASVRNTPEGSVSRAAARYEREALSARTYQARAPYGKQDDRRAAVTGIRDAAGSAARGPARARRARAAACSPLAGSGPSTRRATPGPSPAAARDRRRSSPGRGTAPPRTRAWRRRAAEGTSRTRSALLPWAASARPRAAAVAGARGCGGSSRPARRVRPCLPRVSVRAVPTRARLTEHLRPRGVDARARPPRCGAAAAASASVSGHPGEYTFVAGDGAAANRRSKPGGSATAREGAARPARGCPCVAPLARICAISSRILRSTSASSTRNFACWTGLSTASIASRSFAGRAGSSASAALISRRSSVDPRLGRAARRRAAAAAP